MLGDLRSSISSLEEKGELIRITRKVKPAFEMAAVLQNIQQTNNKAVFFEHVEGVEGPLAANLLGSYERVAYTLACDVPSICRTWASKVEQIPKPDYEVGGAEGEGITAIGLRELPEGTNPPGSGPLPGGCG